SRLSGTLANEPAFIKNLSAGAKIDFGPEHIAAVYCERGDALWVDDSQLITCDEEILMDRAWPSFARRGKAEGDHSGWLVVSSLAPGAKTRDLQIGEL